jgi:hypothetical protein
MASCLLSCISLLVRIHSCFASLGMLMVYNCSNTCLYNTQCTWRREARVSWLSLKTKVDGLSMVWPQNRWLGFPSLGLKTCSSGLVIWVLKSPRRFLSLDTKTKQASVYRLRHKADGGRMAWDTHRYLVACFSWKQVTLGFPSLALRLMEARRWMVHVTLSRRLHWVQVEDGRVDMTGCIGPCYPCFTVFNVLGHRGKVVI